MRPAAFLAGVAAVWSFAACASAAQPAAFDCRADDGHCPEVVVAGDPPAQVAGYGPAPFRGLGDPSLRADPKSGAIWLSYSYVSTEVGPGSAPGKPILDIGVSIRLARSDDGGKSFRLVRKLWTAEPERYEGRDGLSGHEVSTISPTSGGWAALALRYFNPWGNDNDFRPDSFHFEMIEAAQPERLAAVSARFGGPLTAPSWQPFVDLSRLAGVGGACPIWTEPALFEDRGVLYLLAQCKTPQDERQGFLGVFARRAGAWRWLGRIAGLTEAQAFGANELTQADLARSREGGLLLIATPNVAHGRDEHHLGCAVLGVASLDPPALARDAAGEPLVRARIVSSDSAQNGPGACAYDPGSATGVLIVRRVFSPAKGVVFSLHATGLRP